VAVVITDLFEEATTAPAPLPPEWSYPVNYPNSLSMHWAYLSNIPGGGSAPGPAGEALIHPADPNVFGIAYRNDVVFGPDQYVDVRVDIHGDGGAAARISPVNGSCYSLWLTYGHLDLNLWKNVSGAWTQLSTIDVVAFISANPGVSELGNIRLEIVGTSIKSYYGGVLVNTIVDGDIVSGQPGMVADAAGNNIWYTDKGVISFEAGDLTVVTPPSSGSSIYISDSGNDRIIDRTIPDLEYISQYNDGGLIFDPKGICNDGTHLYLINDGKRLWKYLLGNTAADLTYVIGVGGDITPDFWGNTVEKDSASSISHSVPFSYTVGTTNVVICACDSVFGATISGVSDTEGNVYTEVFSGLNPFSEAGSGAYSITDDFNNGTIDDPPWLDQIGSIEESGGTLNVSAGSNSSNYVGAGVNIKCWDFYTEFKLNTTAAFTGDSTFTYLFMICNIVDGDLLYNFSIYLDTTTGNLHSEYRRDDNSFVWSSNTTPLSFNTTYKIAAYFKYSSSAGANDGRVQLWVDDFLVSDMNGLDNDLNAYDSVYPALGSVWMDGTTGSASMKFDDFVFSSDTSMGSQMKVYVSKINAVPVSPVTITANFTSSVPYRLLQVINYFNLKDDPFDDVVLSLPRQGVVASDGNYSDELVTTVPRELVVSALFDVEVPAAEVSPFVVGTGWTHRGGGADPPYSGFSWSPGSNPWYFCEDMIAGDTPGTLQATFTPDSEDYYSTVIMSFKPKAEDQMFEVHGMCTDNTFLYIVDQHGGSSNRPRLIKRRCDDLSYVTEISSFAGGGLGTYFYNLRSVVTDGTFVYVTDWSSGSARWVRKFLCSDLSYVASTVIQGVRPVVGIDIDGSSLFVSTYDIIV
jgi:hypothetical protein